MDLNALTREFGAEVDHDDTFQFVEDSKAAEVHDGFVPPKQVLLAVSGSVAAIKVPELVEKMRANGWMVKIIASHAGQFFFHPGDLPEDVVVHGDEEEWRSWERVGDPVLHIELRRWADALLVAPLSANTMAKMAYGMCDNLLTCVVRAWDWKKPLVVAPAMNTYMWDSPLTAQHLGMLRALGARVVDPVAKTLACGDVGNGAMAAPADLVSAVRAALDGHSENAC